MRVTRAKSTDLVTDMNVRGERERKVQNYSQISGLVGSTDGKNRNPGQSTKKEEQIWKALAR